MPARWETLLGDGRWSVLQPQLAFDLLMRPPAAEDFEAPREPSPLVPRRSR